LKCPTAVFSYSLLKWYRKPSPFFISFWTATKFCWPPFGSRKGGHDSQTFMFLSINWLAVMFQRMDEVNGREAETLCSWFVILFYLSKWISSQLGQSDLKENVAIHNNMTNRITKSFLLRWNLWKRKFLCHFVRWKNNICWWIFCQMDVIMTFSGHIKVRYET